MVDLLCFVHIRLFCLSWPWPLPKINRVHPLVVENIFAKFNEDANNDLVSHKVQAWDTRRMEGNHRSVTISPLQHQSRISWLSQHLIGVSFIWFQVFMSQNWIFQEVYFMAGVRKHFDIYNNFWVTKGRERKSIIRDKTFPPVTKYMRLTLTLNLHKHWP